MVVDASSFLVRAPRPAGLRAAFERLFERARSPAPPPAPCSISKYSLIRWDSCVPRHPSYRVYPFIHHPLGTPGGMLYM